MLWWGKLISILNIYVSRIEHFSGFESSKQGKQIIKNMSIICEIEYVDDISIQAYLQIPFHTSVHAYKMFELSV